jgi:hypothetical protein
MAAIFPTQPPHIVDAGPACGVYTSLEGYRTYLTQHGWREDYGKTQPVLSSSRVYEWNFGGGWSVPGGQQEAEAIGGMPSVRFRY